MRSIINHTRNCISVGNIHTEMIFPRERLGTISALERCFARVLAHVVDEVFATREGLRAEATPVRGLPGVLPHVVQQVLLAGERLRTEVAAVRCLTCK